MDLIHTLVNQVNFKDFVDIAVVSILMYQGLMIIYGTRAVQMLVGVAVITVLSWIGVSYKLYSLTWILDHFFDSFFIILVIIFQDQIRNALVSFGSGRRVFGRFKKTDYDMEIDEVAEVAVALSRKSKGALFVFERTNGLRNYMATGTIIDGKIHSDLLYAIFSSSSALHDGAVIISNGKIGAAGCFLPLSKNVEVDRQMGTRHRAAMGISELTDAIVVITSEETGAINICFEGKFYPISSQKHLRRLLRYLFLAGKLTSEESQSLAGEA